MESGAWKYDHSTYIPNAPTAQCHDNAMNPKWTRDTLVMVADEEEGGLFRHAKLLGSCCQDCRGVSFGKRRRTGRTGPAVL